MKGSQDKSLIFYYLGFFVLDFILFNVILLIISTVFQITLSDPGIFEFTFGIKLFIGLLYNLLFAAVAFYIYLALELDNKKDQLKLF